MSYPRSEYVSVMAGLLIALFVGVPILGISIYGLYLAFTVSVVLGIATFFVEPAPLVFGIAKLFFGVNLPVLIMEWLKAHGG